MKKIVGVIGAFLLLASCTPGNNGGSFTVNGELKNSEDQKVFLEHISFSQKPPTILDTVKMANGKFEVSTQATEEGLYRVRFENNAGYLFINDQQDIDFLANAKDTTLQSANFNTPANASLTNLIITLDSIHSALMAQAQQIKTSRENNNDSLAGVLQNNFKTSNEWYRNFLINYVDTAQSPIVSLFALSYTQEVPADTLKSLIAGLKKAYPENTSVDEVKSQIDLFVTAQQQQSQMQNGTVSVGQMAPDFTLPDVNGKPFTLSSLRGKYVLVDFWASWCGPCRQENPNVVANYNKFKNENFTILGVSLDKDKAAWLQAIETDNLDWKQVSDLKFWNSEAASLYGIQGIPYNVLLDPQGKVIAQNLRGPELQKTLQEVLKK